MFGSPRPIRAAAALVAPALLLFALCTLPSPLPAGAAGTQILRSTVAHQRQRERTLSSSTASLGHLIARLSNALAILSARQSATQSELDASLARLAATRAELRGARVRLARLRTRLVANRRTLADQLRAQYTAPLPDLVNVLLSSRSFADLIDQADFLRRVARANASVLSSVRDARDATRAQARHLAGLQGRQRIVVLVVGRQRDALASMGAALNARRGSLVRARSARLAALAHAVARRRRAQRELQRLAAQQAATAASTAGPGGPWAIPWAVVQCESGGQDLPPNGASASGYYQMTDATWRALGGSTPHAFQAAKSEQDRLASRLWRGGAGASNWVCAALVGR